MTSRAAIAPHPSHEPDRSRKRIPAFPITLRPKTFREQMAAGSVSHASAWRIAPAREPSFCRSGARPSRVRIPLPTCQNEGCPTRLCDPNQTIISVNGRLPKGNCKREIRLAAAGYGWAASPPDPRLATFRQHAPGRYGIRQMFAFPRQIFARVVPIRRPSLGVRAQGKPGTGGTRKSRVRL